MDDRLGDSPGQSLSSEPSSEQVKAQRSVVRPGRVSRSESAGSASGPAADLCSVGSDELLRGRRELLILHGSRVYRLLRTRNDKLILQ